MGDLRILLAHDPADEAWARTVMAALEQVLAARIQIAGDRPAIELRDTFTRLPSHAELGPLSMVLVATPARAFTADEEAVLRRFMDDAPGGDLQLLPVVPGVGRPVPIKPFEAIVAAHLEDPSDHRQIERLATHLLNQMVLRVAGKHRRVFISYRMRDGKAIAEHVEAGLIARGYEVWRDEHVDRDGVALITPGSDAQRTIERGISDQGFVLVIDTPEAHRSKWVREEVAIAVRNLLPMLPLVIEDIEPPQPKIGGRFPELTSLQRQVRAGSAALAPENLASVLGAAFFDELEREMNTILLEHLRARRRLLRDTARRFQALSFTWKVLDPARLLFRAELDRDSEITPDVVLRLLVQCSPYDVVLDGAVENLKAELPGHPEHCQLAILVHQAPLYGNQRRTLVRNRGGNLLLLRSDELEALASMLTLSRGTP